MPRPPSTRLRISDSNTDVALLNATPKVFSAWRKTWSKENQINPKDVAVVLSTQTGAEILDSGAALGRALKSKLTTGSEGQCQIVTRVRMRRDAQMLECCDVWKNWSAPVKATETTASA